MPIGSFLESFPPLVFVAAHVAFLAIGAWGILTRARGSRTVFALYVASQVGFLAYFGGIWTMKTAVLLEQTLMAIVMLGFVLRPAGATQQTSPAQA